MSLRSTLLAASLLALATTTVVAQEAVSIEPSSFRPDVGERVELALRDQRAVAWDDARVVWSMVRIAGTQENSDRAPRADEAAPAGTVRIAQQGAAVIGVDFKPRIVNLDAATMQKLSANQASAPKAPGASMVRLVQSAKTIVRAGQQQPGQSPNVTAKTGQQAELRPTFDPTGIGIGSDIPVVVYAGDGKVPGARLIATHIATGERQEFIANDSAIGSFRLSRAGAWRVELQHLAAAKGEAAKEAPWILYTATLTFDAADIAPQGEAK